MKRFFIAMLALTMSIGMMAQTDANKAARKVAHQQQLQELTTGYVQSFNLSGEKAEQFAQTFMAYNKKMMEVKKLYPTTKVENPTEEQLEQEILAKYNRQRALLDVRLDYYHRLRKVLTPSQIQKIYEDEKARKEKLQQLQGNQ